MSGGIGGGESGVPETLLDTKGQIHGFTDTNFPVDVGSNNQTIYADSAQAAGIAYGASAKSTLTTTGSLLAASGANTLSELSAGATSGHVLTSTGAGSLPTYQAVAGGDDNWKYITTTTLGSANSVLELTTGLGDFDATFHTFFLDQSGGSGFGIDFNPYISTGLLNVSLGYTLQLDGGSSEVNGATTIPIIASSTSQNNCCGNFIMYNVNSGSYQSYTFGRFDYCSSLGGTSNAPNLSGQCYYKTASTVDQVGFRFEQTGATSPLFSTAGFVNSFGWTDTS